MNDRAKIAFAIILTAAFLPVTSFAQRRGPTTFPTVTPAMVARIAALGSRGVRVHDPSTIVKCNDEYWIFYTGRGTPSYHSKDLLTWTAGNPVFTVPPSWVKTAVPANRTGMEFWAPDVIHAANRYLLFYSASSFGKNVSAIGVASNPTLDPADPAYHWTDGGMVVQSILHDDFNCIDPAAALDADGNLWLSFGSFWSGIKLIQLDSATGKRISADSPMYSIAHYDSIEASYIYHHDTHYYLFVDFGLCCRSLNSTYSMRIGRADKITGPYLDKDGKDLLHGGGSRFMDTDGPFVGPGHAGIINDGARDWISCHYYDATKRGMSQLAIRPLSWNADGWPVVETPVEAK